MDRTLCVGAVGCDMLGRRSIRGSEGRTSDGVMGSTSKSLNCLKILLCPTSTLKVYESFSIFCIVLTWNHFNEKDVGK